MGLPQAQSAYTIAEYLTLERHSDERHYYCDGQICAMAGESLEHSTICFNLVTMLGAQLRGKPCRGLSPNMMILSSSPLRHHHTTKGLFSYADLTIVCGEPRFLDDHRDVLLNPSVIIEILSPSTEAFDRGEKFQRYRTHLNSLMDYLLVSQTHPLIDHFQRHSGGQWLFTAVEGMEATLALGSIDCELPLVEVYERIVFPPPESLLPEDEEREER